MADLAFSRRGHSRLLGLCHRVGAVMTTQSDPSAYVARQVRDEAIHQRTRELLFAAATVAIALALLLLTLWWTAETTCVRGECCFSTECL